MTLFMAALHMTAANLESPLFSIPWDTQVTVAGMFVVLFTCLATGLLYMRPHVKSLEARLAHSDATNERNTVALERIATVMEKREVADDTVQRIMKVIQENAAANQGAGES